MIANQAKIASFLDSFMKVLCFFSQKVLDISESPPKPNLVENTNLKINQKGESIYFDQSSVFGALATCPFGKSIANLFVCSQPPS